MKEETGRTANSDASRCLNGVYSTISNAESFFNASTSACRARRMGGWGSTTPSCHITPMRMGLLAPDHAAGEDIRQGSGTRSCSRSQGSEPMTTVNHRLTSRRLRMKAALQGEYGSRCRGSPPAYRAKGFDDGICPVLQGRPSWDAQGRGLWKVLSQSRAPD